MSFREKFWLSLLMIASSCFACRRPGPVTPQPTLLTVVRVPPPAVYALWLEQLKGCLQYLLRADSTLAFHVVAWHSSVDSLVWFGTPTEEPDGGFPCRGERCLGMTRRDSVVISAQQLGNPVVVKHELLHVLVDSPTESARPHGLPWGFCEFVN